MVSSHIISLHFLPDRFISLLQMASNLTVKVHPVVYMTIVDSFMRRSRSTKGGQQSPDKVLGTLLGFYEKGAIQVIFFKRVENTVPGY